MIRNNSLFSNGIFKFSLVVMMMGAINLVAPSSAQAASLPPTACDPEYMDALEARAWMEAQREISQNKSIIYRPDSVMAYTCFDKMVGALLKKQGTWPFSENSTPWGSIENRTDNSTLDVIKAVVGGTLRGHWDGNSLNKFLNDDRYGLEYSYSDIARGDYSCSQMTTVWTTYIHADFIQKADADGFFDFKWYEGDDPRKYGVATPKTPPGDWGDKQTIAFNGDESMFVIGENPNDTNPYEEDAIVTHLDKILPPGVDPAPGSCSGVSPIPTGIQIDRNGDGTISGDGEGPEMVCPNPGCVYVMSSGDCQ